MFLHTMLYSDAWQQRERVRTDLTALQTENAHLEQNIAVLRAKINALRSSPKAQERMVRHGLGYLRSNEAIIHLSER